MPSLVPHTRRNTVRSTRNALPQPPANVYIPSVDGNDPLKSTIRAAVYLPPFGYARYIGFTTKPLHKVCTCWIPGTCKNTSSRPFEESRAFIYWIQVKATATLHGY